MNVIPIYSTQQPQRTGVWSNWLQVIPLTQTCISNTHRQSEISREYLRKRLPWRHRSEGPLLSASGQEDLTCPAPGSAVCVFTLVGGGGRAGGEVSLRTGSALVERLSPTPGAERKVCKAFVNTPFPLSLLGHQKRQPLCHLPLVWLWRTRSFFGSYFVQWGLLYYDLHL